MDVKAINANYGATNFNATAKIMRGNYTKKELVDSAFSGEAHRILDRLESVYKDTTIKIGAKIDKHGNPVVYAINPDTGVEASAPTALDTYNNKIGYNGSMYNLLKTITDPKSLYYLIFWPANKNGDYEFPPENIEIDPSQHKTKLYERSVFVD